MSQKCYGIGAIGCGVIWNHHWTGLQSLGDRVEVRYVYDVDPALMEKAANETGAKGVTDPDEMLEATDVDIVAIMTPPYARTEYVTKACATGKHLMVEKPMARTLEQARQIYEAVRQSGVKCFVPFSRAVNRDWQCVAERIQSGEFGEPHSFTHTCLGTPYGWVSLDHWMHVQELSGGPVFDYSIHFIELARACMGSEASEVIYSGVTTTDRVKSDDHATLIINYQRGSVGQFTKTWDFPPGTDASHQITHIACHEAVIVLGKQIEIITPDGPKDFVSSQGESGRGYGNLIAAIEDDTPLHANEVNGLRTIEILDAALKSRESGRKERVQIHE